MAWTGNYMVTSFKRQLWRGDHRFRASGGHTFKLALYDNDATLNADTTDYTTTNEITDAGYTAGGIVLTNTEPQQSGTAGFCSFADAQWAATLSARGGLVYNTTTNGGTDTTDAVMVLDFGALRTKANFKVVMPTADELNAILRIP